MHIWTVYSDRCQATATIESLIADASHAATYYYGCQADAIIESIRADAGHALGDGEGG